MLHSNGSPVEVAKLWPQIYEMNREVIGEDPNMLQLGLELKLPVID
jgi:nucleoid-associated protein YgaU